MSRDALPCVVCNKPLEDIGERSTNQPYKGTAFISYGHYGSTAFDPMDGRYLELNVCDSCLTELGQEGKVLLGQSHKLVTMPGPEELGGMPSVIGQTKIHRELTPWDPDVESETEAAHLDTFEEYLDWKDKIETRFSDDEIEEMFERRLRGTPEERRTMDETVLCPRCAKNRYTPYGKRGPAPDGAPRPALSRVAEYYICSECGVDEAMRDFRGLPPVPLDEWPIRKENP